MAYKLIYFISSLFLITSTLAAVPVETQSTNKDDFVYVQTLKSGARPISRKEKLALDERPFETSHKLPLSVTYLLNRQEAEDQNLRQKRAAPAPAPAGSIKIDPLKLIQKYKSDLKVNPTTAPKTTKPTSLPKRGRIKKEADPEPLPLPTSPRPSLTSGAPPTPRNLDLDVVPQATGDKQRSRIQIKKGPNGQEYEYEYVYYYYDEDDNKSTTQKVFNSHDGPARRDVPNNSKEKTYTKEASSNEVIPSARGRNRGRQLEEEEAVGEERLPPSTRFPPRGRNFASNTSTSEEEIKATTSGRERGRPTTVANTEAIPEESQNRGRTRSSLRRGSLDLIDNESFNTHSGNSASEQSSNGPSFPSDLPSGPVRFLGATPNERVNLQDQTPELNTEQTTESRDLTSIIGDTTTITISPMDKVALDLYAILQGTQKLSGEEDSKDNDTTDAVTSTYQTETTEIPTTEYVTITTTTTTTTPAPTTTTTTTEAPAFGRGRFRGSANRKKHGSTTSSPSTEASNTETKPKNRFNRPSFGRPKPGTRTTSEPAQHEQKAESEEVKPLSKSRPTSRSRFGSPRVKPTSTESNEEGGVSSSSSKPAFSRPRPGFSSRNRGRTTAASPLAEERASVSDEGESGSTTTPRPKLRISGHSNVRPLRPGLRINLRGQLGGSTTAATEASLQETSQEDTKSSDESKEEAPASPAPVQDKNPLNRLRSRNRLTPTAAPKQKASASATVQVRRVNPLIGRRRIGSTEATSSEAPVELEATEPTVSQENDGTDTPAPSSTTTEEPKGLNKLLAGRRKVIAKHAHQ